MRQSEVAAASHRGFWRAGARGWRVFVPTVIGAAAAQAGLVALPLSAATVVASFALCAIALALVVAEARSAVTRAPFRWPRVSGYAAATLVGAAVVAAALLGPVAALVATVVALPVVTVTAAGGGALVAVITPFRRHPIIAVVALLASAVAIAIAGIAALLLGFFITGAAGAAATWLVFGVIAVVLVLGWTVLHVRSSPS